MIDLSKLAAPFAPDKISWRLGSTNADKSKGMALAYIDARDVQDRLDEVCGHDWQCRYPHVGTKTVCEIGIRIGDDWLWRADGAGDSDVEAEKGALSDAFKRAAVRWGIGRYLYDLDSPWVALEPAGKSFKIKADEYVRLRTVLSKAAPAASKPPPTAQLTGKTDTASTVPATPPSHKAALWVEKAEQEIRSIRTKDGMGMWCRQNAAAIDKLLTTDKALYNALNLKIALRNDELEMAHA